MATSLDGRPVKPVVPAGEDVTASQARDGRWELAHWNRARVAMQNLFNQALPNGFLSMLPDTVSKMDPCEVWALLEQAYGLGDAAGLIELMKQWGRVLATNWKDVGSLFARLKKLRNEINRKTKALVGQEMVTEAWLCIEVLSQLPCELWASSVAMTNESFTISNVEAGLRRVFGDKSRPEVAPYMEKKKASKVYAVKQSGSKRKGIEGQDLNSCFYCFETVYFKKDCPTLKSDRSPTRPGGPLFRTDVKTAPGARKAKRAKVVGVHAVKTAEDDATPSNALLSLGEGKSLNELTFFEMSVETGDHTMVDGLLFREDGHVPIGDEGDEVLSTSVPDLKEIEQEIQELATHQVQTEVGSLV